MITVNKIEYLTKMTRVNGQVNEYACDKPWVKIYTSKGEIEIPLSTEYDEQYYTDKFQKLANLSSGAKLNMTYDFRD